MSKKAQMSKKSKNLLIIAGIIVVVLIIAAVVSFIADNAVKTEKRGNSVSNTLNYGMVAQTPEGDFYSNSGIMKLAADGKSGVEIINESASGLNYWDGWLYYVNYSDAQKLYRVRTDGTGKEKLTDIRSTCVNVVGGKVYFSSRDVTTTSDEIADQGIYVMEADGSGLTRITTDETNSMLVYGGRIYFVNMFDSYKLYSMNLSGKDRKVLAADFVHGFTVSDTWVVYGTSSAIYKVRNDGAGRTLIVDSPGNTIVMDGDTLYYSYYDIMGGNRGTGIVRTDLNGKAPEKLFDDVGYNMCAANGKLYLGSMTDGLMFMLDPETKERIPMTMGTFDTTTQTETNK